MVKRLARLMRRPRTNQRRTIEFDETSDAYIIRENHTTTRDVLHNQRPVLITAATALDAAEAYLHSHAGLLGLDESELSNLRNLPRREPDDVGVEYRFLSEKRQFDVTTVTYQKTCLGIPVWRAGISVHLKHLSNAFKIICAQTNKGAPLSRDRIMPIDDIARLIKPIDEETLVSQLGIADRVSRFLPGTLRIAHQNTMIHHYDTEQRAQTLGLFDTDGMPLPRVPDDIVDGSDNIVSAVYFDLTRTGSGSTHWVALVEARTQSVLYLEEFANAVNGMTFLADPMTTHGGPPPYAANAELNPLRVSTALTNLVEGEPQELKGANIKIVDIDGVDELPPISKNGADFDFLVHTNNFAAVNAYYNCDRFFTFVESLGLNRQDYFPWTEFPIAVDHRGAPRGGVASTDAQTRGNSSPGPNGTEVRMGIESVVFALAEPNDEARPIGNANDWRVVLHELGGHGTLLNHVASTRFPFAHSTGDSLAAILNDPESNAGTRWETFPWISEYDRWHNRNAWKWDGPEDLGDDSSQLDQEQILSTTHFRLYQSMGGANTAQVAVRRFAAKYAAYLILRAIQTLTPVTSPRHASDWLCNLIVADTGDWTSEGLSGGAYEKVVYWAFEKQGLFGGEPPPVDVYIADERGGTYEYMSDYANCGAIWNRIAGDGLEGHQIPVVGLSNFAYVKIQNRGTTAAKSVIVEAFQNKPESRLIYPDDWDPMVTPRISAADLLPNSPEVIVGPFEWVPSAGDNYILMAVSANGDLSNLVKFGPDKSIPDCRLVPNDNNLGMRKV